MNQNIVKFAFVRDMSKFCSSDYYNSKLENLITFTF